MFYDHKTLYNRVNHLYHYNTINNECKRYPFKSRLAKLQYHKRHLVCPTNFTDKNMTEISSDKGTTITR